MDPLKWLVQVVSVPFLGLIAEFVFGLGFGDHAGEISSPLFMGACGYLLATTSPESRSSGRWVWLPFFAFWLVVFLFEFTHSWAFARELVYYDEGEGAWAVIFFTVPVAGCCAYSLGIWLEGYIHRRK